MNPCLSTHRERDSLRIVGSEWRRSAQQFVKGQIETTRAEPNMNHGAAQSQCNWVTTFATAPRRRYPRQSER